MENKQPEAVMIDTLDGFVRALHHWHYNKVQMLKHMQTIPEGTEVSKDEGEPITLTGDVLKGFILGIEVALEEMGELPFEAEVEFTSEEPIIKDSAGNTH
jgi:hypothetical protein